METRIKDETVDISAGAVRKFFDEHARKGLSHKYNAVLFQDNNPELAVQRDKAEKEKILPFLNLKADSYVLDIGCGVGRWADEICPKLSLDGRYVGVDFSTELVRIAKESACPTATFATGAFQEIVAVLKENSLPLRYDIVLINGVCMYINEEDLDGCLQQAFSLLKEGGILYQKESVAYENKLTLKDFYSNELSHDYHAIYRKISEYESKFAAVFGRDKCTLEKGELFDVTDRNRKETTDYYWIIQK